MMLRMNDKRGLRVIEHGGENVQQDIYIYSILMEACMEIENARMREKGRSSLARQYSILLTELESVIGRLTHYVIPTAQVCHVCGVELAVEEIDGMFACAACREALSSSVTACSVCGIETEGAYTLGGKFFCSDCHQTARFDFDEKAYEQD